MAEEAARAEAVLAADTAAERQTERRFMRIRTIKAEERIPSRQMRVAEPAERYPERMVYRLFQIQQKRRRNLHMQTREIFLQFMVIILEMKHVLQPRCSMKYRSNTLLRQEKR